MSALWVVIPAYNEQRWITGTLDGLANQDDDDFNVVVVDNASTDRTAEVVRAHPLPGLHLIQENRKGTGAAADTGMRYAMAQGARFLARTDADSIPAPGWISAIKAGFGDGLHFVAGHNVKRDDEPAQPWWRNAATLAVLAGFLTVDFTRDRLRRRQDSLGPYFVAPGNNIALTAELYLAAGGYPRTSIEERHEDVELVLAVRRISRAYGLRRGMRVATSERRLARWGLRATVNWYLRRLDRIPDGGVDIR